MRSTIYRPLNETLNEQGDQSIRRLSAGHPKRYYLLTKYLSTRKTCLLTLVIILLIIYFAWAGMVAIDPEANTKASTTLKNMHLATNAAGEVIHFTTADAVKNMLKIANYNYVNNSVIVCSEVLTESRLYIKNKLQREYNNLPTIYFITPTYPRREQIPELTRLAHTLMHVPRIHWIVADDRSECNLYLNSVLEQFGIPYTHLCSPMPKIFRKKNIVPRGVSNRRSALQWLRKNNITSGVLYFGDDDNTYDLRLFSEIRDTQRVSMFPVGLIPTYSISGPLVRKGKVIGFLDSWVAKRQWPVDMAGFAINLAYLAEYPNATMPYKAGYEEDLFLRSIALKMNQIEPKASNCTEILVWHTQTKNVDSATLKIKREYLDERSNLGMLIAKLKEMGIANASDTEGLNAILSKNGKSKPFDYFFS